jgi:hypothetical protein
LTGREVEVENRLFILAERYKPSLFWAEYERARADPAWRCRTIDARHDAMIEKPEELASILDSYVQSIRAAA